MTRTLLVALALLASACSPSRRAWRPMIPPRGVSMPAAYAVVPAAVPLAIAPRPDAPRIVPAVERDAYGLPLARASFRVFRILGERNGWAQLETLGEPARAHCADGLETLEPFRLRLFVPVSMLALVTQRETRQEFADGTFIELARGAPLEPLPGVGWFRVHLGGVATTVRLAQADVGTRYLPSAELAPAAAAHALRGDAIGRARRCSESPARSSRPAAETFRFTRRRCAGPRPWWSSVPAAEGSSCARLRTRSRTTRASQS